MNFKKTEPLWHRAEVLSENPEYREKFNCVISKSVAPIADLYGWSKYLIRNGGSILCIKGGNIDEEINELKKQYNEVIIDVKNYYFDEEYKIEDKKLVIIRREK
jgi:16S rRNA G527 N7-methylase RsmG